MPIRSMISETHYLSGTSGSEVGQVFKAEAASILPYAGQYSFEVADAYATGGKVVDADQVNQGQENPDSSKWREELEEIGGKASEGLGEFFDKAKDGANKLFEKGQQWWQQQQQGN